MRFIAFFLNTHLLTAIEHCGYTTPTLIQQQAIPPILVERDLLGLAQTGTGAVSAAPVAPAMPCLLPLPGINRMIQAIERVLAEKMQRYAVADLPVLTLPVESGSVAEWPKSGNRPVRKTVRKTSGRQRGSAVKTSVSGLSLRNVKK